MSRVFFRCDGTKEIGSGHLSRCLALAEALGELGIDSTFCGAFGSHALLLLEEAGVDALTIPAQADEFAFVSELAGNEPDAAIVLDAHRLDSAGAQRFAPERTGVPLLIIDDFARLERYPADACILNFTVAAPTLPYRGERLSTFLGPGFLLARQALRRVRGGRAQAAGAPRRLLVAIGGEDPLALGEKIEAAVAEIDPNLKVDRLSGTCASAIAESFGDVDACITGGGLTKYEAAFVGVPTAVLAQTDDEDAETVQFARAGLGVRLGLGTRLEDGDLAGSIEHFLSDDDGRAALIASAQRTFPADPAARAAEAFRRHMAA